MRKPEMKINDPVLGEVIVEEGWEAIDQWTAVYRNALAIALVAQKKLIAAGAMKPEKRRILTKAEARALHKKR